MKKTFKSPELTIVLFADEDIIVTSNGGVPGNSNGQIGDIPEEDD